MGPITSVDTLTSEVPDGIAEHEGRLYTRIVSISDPHCMFKVLIGVCREIHLSDLIRAHEGNPDYHDDDPGKIHWAKFNMMAQIGRAHV